MGQKEPPRLGSRICYVQELARKSHQDSAVRFVTAKRGPERATKTRQYGLLRPTVGQKEPPSAVRILTAQISPEKAIKIWQYDLISAKSWPERATKTRQYDLLRPRVDQKEPPYDLLQPNVGKKEPPRLGSTICYGQELARKSHQDSALRFVTAKSWPERATKTLQYDLLRPRAPYDLLRPKARKSHQDSAVRFVTAKS